MDASGVIAVIVITVSVLWLVLWVLWDMGND
jgi:hypothetical protein